MKTRIFYTALIGLTVHLVVFQAIAQSTPEDWLCTPDYYNDGDCDCGCNIVDTDCESATAPSCVYQWCADGKYPSWDDNSKCLDKGTDPYLPEGWDCTSSAWDNDECDCGCGILDPECGTINEVYCEGDLFDVDREEWKHRCGALSATECNFDRCANNEYPAYRDNRICLEMGMDTDLPADWEDDCGSYYYEDENYCHCGCGAMDPDCDDETAESCEVNMCYDDTDESATVYYPLSDDNSQCVVPGEDPNLLGWVCPPMWYGVDDGCDCGCGIMDIDCPSASASECINNICESGQIVVPDDNAQCMDESVDTSTDTGADTEPVDTGTGTEPVDTGTGIGPLDTGTGIGPLDTGTGIGPLDTGTGIGPLDTTTESDTDHGSDSATGTDTGTDTGSAQGVITGRPDTYPRVPKKESGDSLFGCTLAPSPSDRSFMQLLF